MREALEGRFTGHHALIVSRQLARIDLLDEAIAELSGQIDEVIAPFAQLGYALRTTGRQAAFTRLYG